MSAGGVLDRSNIEAILPLSPMQEALLFATLGGRAAGSDPGFLQLRCSVRGDLDESSFRQAWQHVVARHAALRSSVHWHASDRPLQVVARRVDALVRFEDWRGLAEDEHRIDAFLGEDRAVGLDPARPPVHRVAMIRITDDEWQMVWSCHHVLLDGWSGALVLAELADAYETIRAGHEPHLPPAPPYRDFVKWLHGTDGAADERFWRDQLAGMTSATPLPFDQAPGSPARSSPRHASVTTELDAEETAALHAVARERRLTTGTMVQGAWALVLAARAADQPVCFGTTVSGRSAPVAGIASMVGVFNNALPVRVAIPRDRPAVEALTTLQERLATIQRHAHASPARIQEWTAVPGARRLFESLVVFENFPAHVLGAREDRRLTWEGLHGGITSSHALVLVAAPGDRLVLTVLHDTERIAAADAKRLADEVRAVLLHIVAAPDALVGALLPGGAGEPVEPEPRIVPNGGMPPANAGELRLCRIWERVLGTTAFGVDDDFFALGGHSLLVARLIAAIETQLDVRLPVATFFREPTVRALAAAIERERERGDAAPRSNLLVPLATGRGDAGRPPFFFLHNLRGDVSVAYSLLRYLDEDQCVYGVQAAGADGRSPPESRLEDMAATYAREIRRLQPEGPYHLGGYCFGGTLAYETARQLAVQGGSVALLTVIDSDPRTPPRLHTSVLVRAWHELRMMPPERRAARIRSMLGHALARLGAAAGGERPAAPTPGEPNPLDDVHSAAFSRYTPRPFAGRVTVILARDDPPGHARWRRRQWAALAAQGAALHSVPGTHYTLMMEPSVRGVAETVQACLNQAHPTVTDPINATRP